MDSTIRLWDLVAGRASAVLTNHKKAVRSVLVHPREYTFVSGAADNLKKWKMPEGKFLHNLSGPQAHHNAILHGLAVNQDDVFVSGADNGKIHLWDWKSGYNFQTLETVAQPGSLESEKGIYACAFDLGLAPHHRRGRQDDQGVEGGPRRHPRLPPRRLGAAARPEEVLRGED